MMFERKSYKENLIRHYKNAWGVAGKDSDLIDGPIYDLSGDFSVLEFGPHGKRAMWTYATCCMSKETDEVPLELHMFSPKKSAELVELLVAVAHFHRSGNHLGLGHTVNFGKPWIDSSLCEYGLISLPYLDGPILENLRLSSGKILKCFWLVPITKSEVEFKKVNGLEALEEVFDKAHFDYLNPTRLAVC